MIDYSLKCNLQKIGHSQQGVTQNIFLGIKSHPDHSGTQILTYNVIKKNKKKYCDFNDEIAYPVSEDLVAYGSYKVCNLAQSG